MAYNPIYFITAASFAGGIVTLTVNGLESITPKTVLKLIFAPNVAVPTGALATSTVQIASGSSTYALKDKFGMPLTLSEIPTNVVNVANVQQTYFRTRNPYVFGVGEETGTPFFISWTLPYPKQYIINLN